MSETLERQLSDYGDYLAETLRTIELEDLVTAEPVEADRVRPLSVRQIRAAPGWVVGIGTAVAALIVIGGVVWLMGATRVDEPRSVTTSPVDTATPSDEPEPATTSPVEIATSFIEAYEAGRIAEAGSYLTADLLLSRFEGIEGILLESAWREATGFTYLPQPCEEQRAEATGTKVRCSYDYHGLHSDEIGLGPYGGSYFDLTIRDGKITALTDHIVFLENGFSDQMWQPFARWVTRTYPDDAAVMYADPAQHVQAINQWSNRSWELRSREYLELRTSPAAYAARAESICRANKARQIDAWEAAETEFIDIEELPGENYLVTDAMIGIALPILTEGVGDLRLVAPPETVRAQYEKDYLLLEQEIEWLRGQMTGEDTPPPAGEPVAHLISSHLSGCTMGG